MHWEEGKERIKSKEKKESEEIGMATFLDLLVIVFIFLALAGVSAILLMFLSKKAWVRKVCFYITVALGIYACSISVRVGWPLFMTQFAFGVALGAVSVAALILERLGRGSGMKFQIAKILAALSLIFGIINAFM